MESVQSRSIFQTSDQKASDEKTSSEKTLDGFHNFSARLGITLPGEGERNLLSKGHYEFNLVTRNRVQLEAAYRGSWIVGQVIDTISEDMTRAGIQITTNEGAEQVQNVMSSMSRLGIFQALKSNIGWGRLYGGAGAVLQIKGQNLIDPIDFDTIEKDSFLGISVYDRWQIYPDMAKTIGQGPEIGLPEYYDIVTGWNLNEPGQDFDTGKGSLNATGRVRVHHSRVIRSVGIQLPFWQAVTEMMWGESVLERMWDRLIAFDTASLATANLINRAQLRTVGIENLREILSGGGVAEEALISQFEYMRRFQQNEGITLLDKNDVFASTAYTFSGLSDVLIQFGQQVSGSAQIPLVRLFGQSPAGMNATGDADIRLYYDSINTKQEANLRNPMEMILKVLWKSLFGVPIPKDLTFSFTPLWQMSAMDKANIAKTNTDTIIEAHQEGAIDTPTMMRELKQSSGDNGIFTHITDEMIEEAENEAPPIPELEPPSPELDKPTEKAKDSLWMKIRNKVNGKKTDHL